MKQNGFRLVQRKFAQGVPIPASSTTVAPAPPERKVDPPFSPRNVYHNNMSAKSLLDIVAMQNIHRHKQPMVLLERLREDEIPAPTPPTLKIRGPLRKRRAGLKAKNNMCLRSGKRKSPEAGKGPSRKRKKLSSESTDDIPLVFFFTGPGKTQEHKTKGTPEKKAMPEKDKKTTTPKRGDKTETTPRRTGRRTEHTKSGSTDGSNDRSFTFKEPSNPIRVTCRYKTRSPALGCPLRKVGRPKTDTRRRSALRSARAPSEAPSARGIAHRLRNKMPISKAKKHPKPAPRRSVQKTVKEEPMEPGPSGTNKQTFTMPAPPPSDCSSETTRRDSSTSTGSTLKLRLSYSSEDTHSAPAARASIAPNATTPDVTSSCPFDFHDSASEGASRNSDWCIKHPNKTQSQQNNTKRREPDQAEIKGLIKRDTANDFDNNLNGVSEENLLKQPDDINSKNNSTNILTKIKDESILMEKIVIENVKTDKSNLENEPDKTTETTCSEPHVLEHVNGLEEPSKDKEKEGKRKSDVTQPTDVTPKHKKLDKKKDTKTKDGDAATKRPDESLEKINHETDGQKTKKVRRNAFKIVAEKKKTAKRTQKEPEKPTRLLRNMREVAQPTVPAVADVYEFDAELEASGPPSGLRARRAQPTQPADKSDKEIYFDVLPASSQCVQLQKKTDLPKCPTACLVNKDVITTEKKKALIENLSSSPTFLDKFLNCLSPEIQTELDNLIAAEQASGEGKASTSQEESAVKQEPSTYLDQKTASVLEAPTFYPTAEEFANPIKYYDKIAPQASRYGLCKIVPPASFKPACNMSDTIRFAVIYQYISKMYSRWGPVTRELAAIKAHLRTQSVVFARSPLLDGSEVNLPKLYHAVERNGGLSNVIQRKRWGRVADEMKLSKLQHPERKLDPIYMRYLLPYATLSDQERQKIMAEVEKCWTTKYQNMLERARNPFQRQNRMLGTEAESESDDDSEDGNTAGALHEAEDCIVQGRTMNLATFKKIATSLMDAHFEPSKQPPSAVDVEKAYWRAVLLGTEHIVANTASIDTGEEGYGFPKDQSAEYGKSPWNLKELARNPNNVLRYLGPVLGVTVPTLHLSMLFSTSCWHRDPHGLPWTEYMHSGAEKIWYGIPRDESANFRRAVETLCPAYCQNKSIWLASEITMVPPNILSSHGVRLSRLLQAPGEYVLVFPEAHTCSITTGFAISESVYFASNAWLQDVYKLFQELRNSCEPTMFSLEQLLVNGSKDPRAPQQVCSVLCTLLAAELEHRRALEERGLKVQERPPSNAPLYTSYFRAWNAPDLDECEYCRSTLYLSKVTGLTGRKSAVCPEHALRLLETKKFKNVELSTLEFLSSYSTSALEEMLDGLESRTADEPPDDHLETIDLTDKDSVGTV